MYTHVCEEFRERITEHIIDREDLSANGEFQRDLLICSSCADFYVESAEMIDAISSVDFAISEDHWNVMADRLRARVESEPAVMTAAMPAAMPAAMSGGGRRKSAARRAPLPWAELLAAAALVLITAGLYRIGIPERSAETEATEYVYVDRSVPLDPVTVDFLEESELLLRTVMKMEATDVDDLADARRVAASQLVAIEQRKEAAAVVPPVLNLMQTYETILRDIRNLNEDSPADDIGDIQNRIQNNALIAGMMAFQPTISVVGVGLR